MFSAPSTILSSELKAADSASPQPTKPPRTPFKRTWLILSLILSGFILLLVIFFIGQKYFRAAKPSADLPQSTASGAAVTSSVAVLPSSDLASGATTTISNFSFSSSTVEYLSFASFYEPPDNQIISKINDYQLPLNVKIDVLNYYDVSRKLNLDAGLDNLNNNGFTVINNPWLKEAPDFSAIYSNLNSRQIPLLVTADFIIYQYQSVVKKVFKDVEENVFYDNLWDIAKKLYTAARDRYESRLAALGNINDPVLEGERLETVFFAVALELLKPSAAQISAQPNQGQVSFFTKNEAERFYFVTPTYLRDDVEAELKLIRAASPTKIKSPVLLYKRSYTDFVVPADYRPKAKLNNFYLATRWLNSLFPLNYRDKICPDCLLDKADWRVSFTAASLMAQDFSALPELKNKWARIYKVISFFQGLREDLSYLHYRDSLAVLFGPDYKIEELFADQNKEVWNNLGKLRTKLSIYEFPEIFGAPALSAKNFRSQQGFRVLAQNYWPNDYIFSHLLSPVVGNYSGTSTKLNNITACANQGRNSYSRCAGFVLDAVNLVYPISNQDYFSENTNYVNYNVAAQQLAGELNKNSVWPMSNYWTNLKLIKSYLDMAPSNLPLFSHSAAWFDKNLETVASAWINFQLPADQITLSSLTSTSNLGASGSSENSYVEPNLALVNELLANNNMLVKMFSALQLDIEVRLALQDLTNFSDSLLALKKIILKELSGQALDANDNEAALAFVKQLKVSRTESAVKQLYLRFPSQNIALKEDLSRLQLLVLTYKSGDNKIFAVGPVWDYQESR